MYPVTPIRCTSALCTTWTRHRLKIGTKRAMSIMCGILVHGVHAILVRCFSRSEISFVGDSALSMCMREGFQSIEIEIYILNSLLPIWVMDCAKRVIGQWESKEKCRFKQSASPILSTQIWMHTGPGVQRWSRQHRLGVPAHGYRQSHHGPIHGVVHRHRQSRSQSQIICEFGSAAHLARHASAPRCRRRSARWARLSC